jgi:acyl-CoA thioesterase-1
LTTKRSAFAAMFSGLAREHNVLFYAVFDSAFVDQPQLKLSDGLHPNAAGIDAGVADILPRLEALIDRTRHLHR